MKAKSWIRVVLCGVTLAAAACSTGCQITEAGQTLPSPYYYFDDVQYFAPGTEFKLPREAAAQRAAKAEAQLLLQ